jgi:two-component sensor histidine kinase
MDQTRLSRGSRAHRSRANSPLKRASRRQPAGAPDNTELRPESELTRELKHRLRNVFPLVLMIIKHTAGRYPDAAEYCQTLERRLRALAAAATLVDCDDPLGVGDIIRLELAPFQNSDNILIGGPDVRLEQALVQDFAILIHELATNAAKHGALSSSRGRLSVTWSLRPVSNGQRFLVLKWIETGGPQVGPIKTQGFGTMVIAESGSLLGGTASAEYAPEGFRYRLSFSIGAAAVRHRAAHHAPQV